MMVLVLVRHQVKISKSTHTDRAHAWRAEGIHCADDAGQIHARGGSQNGAPGRAGRQNKCKRNRGQ